MTHPVPAQKPASPWYLQPVVILSLLGICVLLTALLTKTPISGRNGDPRLTTRSTDPQGAKLLYELAGRMGYTTLRSSTTEFPAGRQIILAVLDPVVDLNATEVHAMLEHARAGGGLLVALGNGTRALADSLHVSIDSIERIVTPHMGSTRQCESRSVFTPNGLWLGLPTLFALKLADSSNADLRVFTYANGITRRRSADYSPRPSSIGLPVGAGRVVIASDPDVLRNDALRFCGYGFDVAASDAVTYLTEGGTAERRTIVFDEFHQGGFARAGMTSLMREYLVETPSGRTVLQLCLAGLVLLIAAMPRVLPPRTDRRIERRSPLEHVDALARAYAQVGATRTGVLRLVRGLERRLASGRQRVASNRSDDDFLARIAESKPGVSADVAAIRHALNNTVSPQQFTEVGHAISRVEAALTRI